MDRTSPRAVTTVIAALTLLFVAAPAANAIPNGTGVRGTMNVSWGGFSGAPITSWNGSMVLAFDSTAAGRQSVLDASTAEDLGEGWRPLFAPQVQAVRVTSLVSDKAENVTCLDDALNEYTASWTWSSAGIADGRISFEILEPKVNLIGGTGTIVLQPYIQANSSAGDTGWWVNDRLVVPGRWNMSSSYPCPGTGTPATQLPRILAANGGSAVPRAFIDWIANHDADEFLLRRGATGRWRVLGDDTKRITYSESPFGPQDTQQFDLSVRSELYLAGTLAQINARCKVPSGLIERARTTSAALLLAKRAGLTNTTFTGTKVDAYGGRTRYVITGKQIDSQGHAPCYKGSYRITKYLRRG